MFVSFFPRPNLFFPSAVLWSLLCILGWYFAAEPLAADLGISLEGAETIVGVGVFWSQAYLYFYLYFALATTLFAGFWLWFAPHPWAPWSILGSALILFTTYFDVQVDVAVNTWYGPFYDLIQAALSRNQAVTLAEFYGELATFTWIAFLAVAIGVITRFFVSHYIFRWRTAMNGYYMAHWPQLRTIEGAAQRVQEDTMRFSSTMEGLGVSLISSVMTLIAFLPVLLRLSGSITELPLLGQVPHPLVFAAITWSLFGTLFLALVGIKLPGLEFRNQRVEAAYRKELVYGEDDPAYAQPPTVAALFSNVRRSYFTLYFHYCYFNIARIMYLQADTVFPYLVLGPAIVIGAITLGTLNQILNAFDQVRASFQYLVNSWPTIVDLLSVYKRLRGFEAAIDGVPVAAVEAAAPA